MYDSVRRGLVLVEIETANSGSEIVVLKVRQLFKAQKDDKNNG